VKLTPDDERVLERMAPGALTRDGFLGDDPRPLSEILAADDAAVARLGLTHAAIAAALQRALEAARGAFGRPVALTADLTAIFSEALGRIPSPWPGEGLFPKGEVELSDARSGRTIRYTPLSVHLVARHGFYQGRGSRYRLEPEEVCRLLDLLPPDDKPRP
jgi:hypothetical protein